MVGIMGVRQRQATGPGMSDSPVTIFHNPACGTSRAALALLGAAGHEPEVVEYLKVGWTRPQLEALLARMGATPRDLLRRRGTRTLAAASALLMAYPGEAAAKRLEVMQTLDTLGAGARRLEFANGNALVGRTDGVIGMKSGFTSRAGKCVIAVAVRGPHSVWLVMLGATASGMDIGSLKPNFSACSRIASSPRSTPGCTATPN